MVVRDLRVETVDGIEIVDEIAFEVSRGEVVALVGESGCGKTATAMACLGFARPGTRITSGRVFLGDTDILSLDWRALRRRRGRSVSYVPQDPAVALNPGLRIGDQLEEMLAVHLPERHRGVDVVEELLESVHLPRDSAFLRRYPHQLSGGQQQRVMIAMALVCRPQVIILDEPTTGLDVTTQARILRLIDELRATRSHSMLYVTHDLAVVSAIADRVVVMYAGRIVEEAPKQELFASPRHPYTQRLLAAIPGHLHEKRRLRGIPGDAAPPGQRPDGCFFAPRCAYSEERCREVPPVAELVATAHIVRCHRWNELDVQPLVVPARDAIETRSDRSSMLLTVEDLTAVYPDARRREVTALECVSFSVARRETLGVVGESGSGKTTLARCIVGLHEPTAGTITFDGSRLAGRATKRDKVVRRRIQIVFQNPDASLNPRQAVSPIIGRPLEQFFRLRGRLLDVRINELLDLVRLPQNTRLKYPRELSGGEKQRVAIAAALAAQPDMIVCDEVTSALDVSVQAAVIELLLDLAQRLETSFLFISHDLAVVRAIADRVLVLQDGRVKEEGDADAVFRAPKDPYTVALVNAVPEIRVPVEAIAVPSEGRN